MNKSTRNILLLAAVIVAASIFLAKWSGSPYSKQSPKGDIIIIIDPNEGKDDLSFSGHIDGMRYSYHYNSCSVEFTYLFLFDDANNTTYYFGDNESSGTIGDDKIDFFIITIDEKSVDYSIGRVRKHPDWDGEVLDSKEALAQADALYKEWLPQILVRHVKPYIMLHTHDSSPAPLHERRRRELHPDYWSDCNLFESLWDANSSVSQDVREDITGMRLIKLTPENDATMPYKSKVKCESLAFHYIYILSDGSKWGEKGAVMCKLGLGGRKVSEEEFHEVYPIDNGYIGKLGGQYYLLNKNGKKLSDDGYHDIYLTEYGYIGELGALYYILGSNGKTISDGYHMICKTEDGYAAELGASEFQLDMHGKVIIEH